MKNILKSLKTPHKIQTYLDNLTYNAGSLTRSASAAIRKKTAHCFDGALIAAAALEFYGHKPLIMDLQANGNDDDHVLAVYTFKKHYGAIAKSNYVGIRFREPVYRSIRELALSYFNNYVTVHKERTLVKYSRPVNLSNFTQVDWRNAPEDTDVYDALAARMDRAQHYRLFSKAIERNLGLADQRLVDGETLGINWDAIY